VVRPDRHAPAPDASNDPPRIAAKTARLIRLSETSQSLDMKERKSNFGDFREKLLFVGIGAQNAGTTWLYSYLFAHPQVYMSPIKELHYFDVKYLPDMFGGFRDKLVRRLRKKSGEVHYGSGGYRGPVTLVADLLGRIKMDADEGEYTEFFRNRVKNEIAFGEITPSYALLPKEGFRCIRERHENVKLIFLMKDPGERFWSRVRKLAKKTNDSGQNVRAEDLFFSLIKEERVAARSMYHVTIENVLAVFPEDRVHFGFFENLFNDESVRRITGFLGIEFKKGKYGQVKNPTPPREMTDEMKDLARKTFAPVYEYCFDRFGDQVPRQWRVSYDA
jgi:hypothetical protein